MNVDEPQLAARTTTWPERSPDDRWASRLAVNGSRLRRAWADFLARMPWDWFVTLTFGGPLANRLSRDDASREAFWWCGLAARVYRRPIAWAYVVERNRNGAHHVHVLIAGLTDPKWSASLEPWHERNGRITHARRIDGPYRAALYTTKAVPTNAEIVLSDTMDRYKRYLTDSPVIDLTSDR